MPLRTLVIYRKGQNININRSFGEIDSNFTDDCERFKTLVEEGTAHVAEIARELELEVELEVVTGLLQFHDITLMDEELFLMKEESGGVI